jgi:hypothetical protein
MERLDMPTYQVWMVVESVLSRVCGYVAVGDSIRPMDVDVITNRVVECLSNQMKLNDRASEKPSSDKTLSDETIRELIGRIDRYHGNSLKERDAKSIMEEVRVIRRFLSEKGSA